MAKIFIGAGEHSGDFLGAQLLKSLKMKDSSLTVFGIGGKLMQSEGMHTLFPMEELSLMGFFEIFPKLFSLIKRLNETVDRILKEKPDAIITIDAPDFYLRLIKKLKKRGCTIPCIHYNAPAVWATRPKRAKKIAKFVDFLLTLLPFEPPYFTKHGMKCEFVGHPLTEIPLEPLTLSLVPDGKDGILILPGSRSAEIQRLLPIFIQAASLLFQKNRNLLFLIPTFQRFESFVRSSLKDVSFPYLLIPQEQKWQAFQQAKAALAASGTVSLELAKASVPMVISYKLNYLTYLLAKVVIKTPWVCLINILLQKEVIKERLQSECKAAILANDIESILKTSENEKVKGAIKKAYNLLKPDLEKPSEKAARLIYEMIPCLDHFPD